MNNIRFACSALNLSSDSEEIPHTIKITPTNTTDRAGGIDMLQENKEELSTVKKVLVDSGYSGLPFAMKVQEIINASVEVVKLVQLHKFVVFKKNLNRL